MPVVWGGGRLVSDYLAEKNYLVGRRVCIRRQQA